MSEKKTIRAGAVCLLVSLLAALFFTACVSKAVNAADKIELGQKYLTELNYTEAVASFTEAIKLDPDNIQAYMGVRKPTWPWASMTRHWLIIGSSAEQLRICPTHGHFLTSARRRCTKKWNSLPVPFRITDWQRHC